MFCQKRLEFFETKQEEPLTEESQEYKTTVSNGSSNSSIGPPTSSTTQSDNERDTKHEQGLHVKTEDDQICTKEQNQSPNDIKLTEGSLQPHLTSTDNNESEKQSITHQRSLQTTRRRRKGPYNASRDIRYRPRTSQNQITQNNATNYQAERRGENLNFQTDRAHLLSLHVDRHLICLLYTSPSPRDA